MQLIGLTNVKVVLHILVSTNTQRNIDATLKYKVGSEGDMNCLRLGYGLCCIRDVLGSSLSIYLSTSLSLNLHFHSELKFQSIPPPLSFAVSSYVKT